MRSSVQPCARGPRLRSVAGALPLLALLVLSSPANADPYPRQSGLDVRSYAFDLALSDASDRIDVHETVEVSFSREGMSSMALDLCSLVTSSTQPDPLDPCQVPQRRSSPATGKVSPSPVTSFGKGMIVTSVKSGDQRLAFEHRNNRLRIALPRPSRMGERLSLTLAYHGVPAAGLFIGRNEHGDRVFFSDGWPNKTRNWLATIDHISVKAPKTISVTAPLHYQVISNGLLKRQVDLPGNLRRTTWHESVPIPSWQFSLGVAPMAVDYLGSRDGVEFSAWLSPHNKKADLGEIARLNESVFDFFSERIGPYPFGKLAHVEAAGGLGAMELATSIFYNGSFDALPHEVAHQWFGNSVTEADWDHIWLSEGLATYFSLLHTEHAKGRDSFLQALRRTRDGALKYALANPEHTIIHKDLRSDSQVLYNAPQIYSGGAMVLHTLRGVVGDRHFWAGMRLYYRRHRDSSVTTADLQHAMEDACRASGDCPSDIADLGWFFEQWLRRGGAPEVAGEWNYDPEGKVLHVSLSQQRGAGFYRIPAEILIRTPPSTATPTQQGQSASASERRVKIVMAAGHANVSIPLEAMPTDVQLDPDTWVPLMKARLQKK